MRADNRHLNRSKSPVLYNPPLRCRRPGVLPEGDNRFSRQKAHRVFVCDACGHMVYPSKVSKKTGFRYLGEFQGSYSDHAWAGIFAAKF